jgi:hypothetical protein
MRAVAIACSPACRSEIEKSQRRNLATYLAMKTLLPLLDAILWELNTTSQALVMWLGNKVRSTCIYALYDNADPRFLFQLTAAASQARSDDASMLRKQYRDLVKKASQLPIHPPFDSEMKKSGLGYNHPTTTRLLLPAKLQAEYDANPEESVYIYYSLLGSNTIL